MVEEMKKEVSVDRCDHKDCSIVKFDESFCVLHCEKETWYEIKDGKKDWNNNNIIQFWAEFNKIKNLTIIEKLKIPKLHFDMKINGGFYNEIMKLFTLNEFFEFTFYDIHIENWELVSKKFEFCVFYNCTFMKTKFLDVKFEHIETKEVISFYDCIMKDTGFLFNENIVIDIQKCNIENGVFDYTDFNHLVFSSTKLNNTSFHESTVVEGGTETFRHIKKFYKEMLYEQKYYEFHSGYFRPTNKSFCVVCRRQSFVERNHLETS